MCFDPLVTIEITLRRCLATS